MTKIAHVNGLLTCLQNILWLQRCPEPANFRPRCSWLLVQQRVLLLLKCHAKQIQSTQDFLVTFLCGLSEFSTTCCQKCNTLYAFSKANKSRSCITVNIASEKTRFLYWYLLWINKKKSCIVSCENALFSGLTEVDVTSGDISIGSTSGNLKAQTKSGDINVNLSHHDDVTLQSKEGNKEPRVFMD